MSNKNVTLKDTSFNSLFPKTFTHLVYNTNNESLDNTLSNMNTKISNKIEFSEDVTLSPSLSPLNDYYNKSSVDTLLNAKVDKSPTLTSSSVTINSKTGTKYTGSHIVVESWKSTDGTQWYRKWSDGFKECGGYVSTSNSASLTVTLPVSFSNTTFTAIGSFADNSGQPIKWTRIIAVNQIQMECTSSGNKYMCFYCCGY